MNLKSTIKNAPVLGSIARWIYWRVKRAQRKRSATPKIDPADWIGQIVTGDTAFAVQIGSNDGKTSDPLHKLLKERERWGGLFVEPVPHIFERLRNNYPDSDRFSFENSIINDGSNVKFYWVSEKAKESDLGFPPWHDQLGGFDRSHITSHIPELEPFIEEAELDGITIDQLLRKHGVSEVDILHIDTEGSDYKILSQLDLDAFQPLVILYERKHLPKEEETASVRFLEDRYAMYNLGADVLAVRDDAHSDLRSTLEPLAHLKIGAPPAP